jgi:hypothetical protein
MAIWNILRPFGIFYGHLEYITAIWYILWAFGNLVAVWYISPRFGISKKIWQPERFQGDSFVHPSRPDAAINAIYQQMYQGCQIFVGTTYQNGKNIQNNHKMYQIIWP